MFKSKYGIFLTILLIVIIIIILIGVCFLVYKYVKNRDNAEDAIANFDDAAKGNNTDNNTEDNNGGDNPDLILPDDNNNTDGNKGVVRQYYNNFVMIGYIEIPKTNLKLPILEKGTDKSLEVSVAIMYPNNPVLNSPRQCGNNGT